MQNSQIANDAVKLNACVDAMSNMLARCLILKDPTMLRNDTHLVKSAKAVAREWVNSPNLGVVMQDELRSIPSREQLDHLDSLASSHDFAVAAEDLATRMLEACGEYDDGMRPCDDDDDPTDAELATVPEVDGVVLSAFATEMPYFMLEQHPRRNGDTIALGGIGKMLYLDVVEDVASWLEACERMLCSVHNEPADQNDDIDDLVDRFSRAVAKRVTLLEKPTKLDAGEEPPMAVDYLSANYLGLRNLQEYARTRAETQVQVRNDLFALKMLLTVAGMTTTLAEHKKEAIDIVSNKLYLVARVVDAPPAELGLVGENAKRMNLQMLARVLTPSMPVECRIAIATRWSQQHGAYSQTAINEAIRRLEGYSPAASSQFVNVVTRTRTKGAVLLPTAQFSPNSGIWFVIPVPMGASTRMGPDSVGRRIIRLNSLMWAMQAHGAFEEGVIAADIVVPVAVEAFNHAKLLRQIIENERRRCNLGCRILSFEQSIHDKSCDLATDINKAVCEMSMFSLADVFTAFHPSNLVLPTVLETLTTRTRQRLGNLRSSTIAPEYTQFARDALALLLPAFEQRRVAIGLVAYATPNLLADLVRSVHEVHEWSPLQGRFTIDADQLRLSHSKLRAALEHYAAQPDSFVHADHIRVGGGRLHRPVRFTFESTPLLRLLRM